MTSLFPWESVKVKTLRSVSRDLGLSASGTKREMIENLQGVAGVDSEDLVDTGMSSLVAAAAANPLTPAAATQSSPPFDLSSLRFVVHLVTSSDGRYREPEEDDEDFEADENDPWLKMYFVQINTTNGTRVGQFGYRVIDNSARYVSPCAMVQGNPPRVLTWYNLAQRLKFSGRGGQYLENFGHLWYNNPPHNPRDGGLKEEYITGDRKGTGVFQKELNKGSIAFISDDYQYAQDDFFINEEFRRRGIGKWALETLFRHETLRKVKFVFVEPWATGVNQRDEDQAMVKAANDGVQLFFRKAGFRRVGQSAHFAYAADENHRSRRLAIEDDVDYKPPSVPFDPVSALLGYS